jgi:serine/threonine-protein kinase
MASIPGDEGRTTHEGTLDGERFGRVRAIFEEALEQPAPGRAAFVARACVGEPDVEREVLAMLAADAEANPLLDARGSPGPRGPGLPGGDAVRRPGPLGPGLPDSTPEEGRFPAGTVLAGRYRILGLLGRGGMGEVYRAHDLILNQTVALKFLKPAHLSEAALARFRNEVRIARQVSHPHVCRVYDLGMVEGLHFLSMEYIDGEDLASLLRRIGRLPQDKAIEFTRKICAGLGAAHERGVLHRDLKPANIMIDGRGQPRITDFGLAGLAAEIPLSDLRSGTPAYMSPEQKAGKDVTTRSDIYALGLVLHEMFTGKRRADTQSHPSDLVKDLDPTIERLILRCLDDDPKRRPATALNVAMALPGADPIAAALAAGETPSPEMVAASEEKASATPRVALSLLVAIAICLVAHLVLRSRVDLLAHARLDTSPEVLQFKVQERLRQLGYSETPADSSRGFFIPPPSGWTNRLEAFHGARRLAVLAAHRPSIVEFWYRQHQAPLRPEFLLANGDVAFDNPPNDQPGMIQLVTDPTGRLLQFEARPSRIDGVAGSVPDWQPLFDFAGIDPARFTAVEPAAPVPADVNRAWIGTYSDDLSAPVRIEAAAWHGRPIYFRVGDGAYQTGISQGRAWLLVLLLIAILTGGSILAHRNLKLGRGDRRNAAVLAAIVFATQMLIWAIGGHHVAELWEVALMIDALSQALFTAAVFWLTYIAIEPYVRRHWPDSLISWNRFAAGRFRDPLVASHLLLAVFVSKLSNVLGDLTMDLPQPITTVEIARGSYAIEAWLFSIRGGLQASLGLLIIVVVLRLVLRRVWPADLIAALAVGAVISQAGLDRVTDINGIVSGALAIFAVLFVLRRFGFLPFTLSWILSFPTLLPVMAGSWYAGRALAYQLVPLALAVWAAWVIASNRTGAPDAMRTAGI